MAAIVIFMTLLAVVVFAVTANVFPERNRPVKQTEFRDYWHNIRVKQGRMTTARRRL